MSKDVRVTGIQVSSFVAQRGIHLTLTIALWRQVYNFLDLKKYDPCDIASSRKFVGSRDGLASQTLQA